MDLIYIWSSMDLPQPLKKQPPKKVVDMRDKDTARRVSGFRHTQTLNICQTQCQNMIELSNKMSEYQNICQLKCQIR
jgi:hypothetical protein